MEFIGEVKAINTSDGYYNLAVINKEGKSMNLKIKPTKDVVIGTLYKFEYNVVEAERVSYWITSYTNVLNLPFEERDAVLREYYKSSPLSYEEAKKEIEGYLSQLDNSIVKEITKYLINKYHEEFYLFPAASRMHHAYVGGLAYHSIGMLHFADGFIENYPYLDKNYIYAGIMLHDIGKAVELTGIVNTEYSVKGQLLGHLVLGALEIEEAAIKLGYKDTNEAMLLEHMLISHHGVPQFGSAKKPMTAEALALWYIDTIDSKFRVLGEVLDGTESGMFTDPIGVLDRSKIFKA